MVQSLLETEIGEVVGDQLVAQEGGELFVLLQKRVFEVGAEELMAVLHAIDDGFTGDEVVTPTMIIAGVGEKMRTSPILMPP